MMKWKLLWCRMIVVHVICSTLKVKEVLKMWPYSRWQYTVIHENNLHFRSSVNFELQCLHFSNLQPNHIFLFSLLIRKCLRTDVDRNIPSFIIQELIKWRYCEVNKSQVSCEQSIIPDWGSLAFPVPFLLQWSSNSSIHRLINRSLHWFP